MNKFNGMSFNNHWSKWHGSKKVFGLAICLSSLGLAEVCWSFVFFGFEFCFWFIKD